MTTNLAQKLRYGLPVCVVLVLTDQVLDGRYIIHPPIRF